MKRTLFFISLLFLALTSGAYASQLYWTESGGAIKKSNIDGTNVQTVISGLGQVTWMDFDLTNNKMYWVTWGGTYESSNLDGTGRQILVSGLGMLGAVAVNTAGGKVYWSDTSNSKIVMANLDGSGQTDIFTSGQGYAHSQGMQFDSVDDKLYWSDYTGKIHRTDADGSNRETLTPAGGTSIRAFEIDQVNDKIYYANYLSSGGVYRANLLDGSNVESLYPTSTPPYIEGLTLDSDYLYFYVTGEGIRRSNLDGTGVTTLVNVASAGYPYDIKIVPDPFNTMPGTNVQVALTGSDFIRHQNVTVAGNTNSSAYSGFSPSQDFSFMGDYIDETFFDIVTTATNTGDYLVALHYTDQGFTDDILSNASYDDFVEAMLRGFHLEGGVWVDRTATAADLAFFGVSDVPINTSTNTIYMRTSSLSPFGVGVNPEPATLLLLGSALLGLFPFGKKLRK